MRPRILIAILVLVLLPAGCGETQSVQGVPTAAVSPVPAWITPRAGTLTPTFSEDPSADDYIALVERIRRNTQEISGYQFAIHDESMSRPGRPDAVGPGPLRRSDLTVAQEIWPLYLADQQADESEYFGLSELNMDASLDVVVHDVIEQESEGAKFVIEVLTWQAAPGLYMPATLYRPVSQETTRYPVVMTPPGCSEDVATHNEFTSVQRRMANLALSGMVSFTTEGLCFNGLTGMNPENRYQYEYYSLIAGGRVSGTSLEMAIWLRALDFLASREDTDMSRVGVTGYSNGASIAARLASITNRVHAVAIVATNLGYLGEADDSFFVAARDITVDTEPYYFYYGGHWRSPFSALQSEDEAILEMRETLLGIWTPLQLGVATRLGAPRPIYILLGASDELYSAFGTSQLIKGMDMVWSDLGAVVAPQLEIVSGSHVFDATRRSRIRAWLAEVLLAEPLLPLSAGAEYETAVLPASQLQVAPQSADAKSLRAIFASVALQVISARQAEYRMEDQSRESARSNVRNLLGIAQLSQSESKRPILVDDTHLQLGADEVQFRYWLIPVLDDLRTGMVVLASPANPIPHSIDLYISTEDGVLPKQELVAALSDGKGVAVVLAPGFGEVSSAQMTTGNLARSYMEGPTLLGLDVLAVDRAVTVLHGIWPDSPVNARARGIDAGVIASFALALDERIDSAEVEDGLRSFREILTSPDGPVPPPSLLVPGVISDVDLPQLRWLSAPRPIEILSEGDIGQFIPLQ